MRLLILLLLLFSSLFFILSVSQAVITYQFNETTAWWGEFINISGTAINPNGTVIPNTDVNITIGDDIECNNVTDSNGDWICYFSAPNTLGSYKVTINITNSSGTQFGNSTTLDVKLKYGPTVIGTIDRAVYETPILIQELSGKIRKVIVRVLVWRS